MVLYAGSLAVEVHTSDVNWSEIKQNWLQGAGTETEGQIYQSIFHWTSITSLQGLANEKDLSPQLALDVLVEISMDW